MPLIPPTATFYAGGANDEYYLRKGAALPSGQVLTSDVAILAADGSTQGTIRVVGNEIPTYKGAMTLFSGTNASGTGQVILTGRTTGANTVQLEVGDNDQTSLLMIGGASGLSQVNDPVYNPATAQQLVNILGPFSDPDHPSGWLTDSPAPGSFPGSASSPAFSVSKTGLYYLQVQLYMPAGTISNKAFSYAFTVATDASPFTPVGGLNFYSPEPTAAPAEDIPGYWTWGSYIPLTANTDYDITVRGIDGGVAFGVGGQVTVQLINIA